MRDDDIIIDKPNENRVQHLMVEIMKTLEREHASPTDGIIALAGCLECSLVGGVQVGPTLEARQTNQKAVLDLLDSIREAVVSADLGETAHIAVRTLMREEAAKRGYGSWGDLGRLGRE